MDRTVSPLQRPTIFRKSGRHDHRVAWLQAMHQGKNGFGFTVPGQDPRGRNLMMLRQRGMQLRVIDIRVTLRAVQIVDNRPF